VKLKTSLNTKTVYWFVSFYLHFKLLQFLYLTPDPSPTGPLQPVRQHILYKGNSILNPCTGKCLETTRFSTNVSAGKKKWE